jgi:hypothetical protein
MHVHSIFDHVREARARRYISKRDEYRARDGKEPYWYDNSIQLAAVVWRLVKGRVMHRARSIRFIWDWHRHGGNRAKGAKPEEREELGACDVCGAPDSQEHWLADCAHPELVRIREGVFKELKAIARNGQTAEELRYVAQYFFDKVPEADSRRLWVSNWSGVMRKEFCAKLKGRGYGGKHVQLAVIHCGEILARGVSKLWATRKVIAECVAAGKEISAAQIARLAKRSRQEVAAVERVSKSRPKQAVLGKLQRIDGLGYIDLAAALDKLNVQHALQRRRRKVKSLMCSHLQSRKRRALWVESYCSDEMLSEAKKQKVVEGDPLQLSGLEMAEDLYEDIACARDEWWQRRQAVYCSLQDKELEKAVRRLAGARNWHD